MCVRTEYVLACCRIRDSIYFDMQHGHVLKKLNFDLFTPWWGGGGAYAGKTFAATMLLHS